MALIRVIETIDVDCDGIYHAFHTIRVPADRADDVDRAFTYAAKTGQLDHWAEDTPGALFTTEQFLSIYAPKIALCDREVVEQWQREGYWSFVQYRPEVSA